MERDIRTAAWGVALATVLACLAFSAAAPAQAPSLKRVDMAHGAFVEETCQRQFDCVDWSVEHCTRIAAKRFRCGASQTFEANNYRQVCTYDNLWRWMGAGRGLRLHDTRNAECN